MFCNPKSVYLPDCKVWQVVTFHISKYGNWALSGFQNMASGQFQDCKTWQVGTFRIAKHSKWALSGFQTL